MNMEEAKNHILCSLHKGKVSIEGSSAKTTY